MELELDNDATVSWKRIHGSPNQIFIRFVKSSDSNWSALAVIHLCPMQQSYEYKLTVPQCEESFDVMVLGAGPAGLACAKEVDKLGGSALIIDNSQLQPGCQWSHGGSCSNYGLAKKLINQAANLKKSMEVGKISFVSEISLNFSVPGSQSLWLELARFA